MLRVHVRLLIYILYGTMWCLLFHFKRRLALLSAIEEMSLFPLTFHPL